MNVHEPIDGVERGESQRKDDPGVLVDGARIDSVQAPSLDCDKTRFSPVSKSQWNQFHSRTRDSAAALLDLLERRLRQKRTR